MRTARPGPLLALVLLAGCHHDHAHGQGTTGHDHKGGAEHGKKDEPEPESVTVWTDRHELFVEFPPPAPGKPVAFHAHVTRLAGFQAVTEGVFHVRFRTPTGVVEARADAVKRPGIFTPEIAAAPAAGSYALEMRYEHAGTTDVFDCGKVEVLDKPKPAEPEAGGAKITFLKEAQWKIPFGTASSGERPMAKEIELPATIEPAANDQLTIGAPTGGRFFHDPNIALAEGRRVKKGEVIGSIVPNVAGDDYSRLQLAADETRLAREQTQREIQRIEPLVQQNLLPERRLIELRNELETLTARQRAAQGRLGRVQSPGGTGGLPIKSSLDGVVSHVLVANGEPVESGAPLVRLGGTESRWIRARFVARPAGGIVEPSPTGVRLPNGERVDLVERGARLLSPLPVTDPVSRVATWIVEVTPRPAATPGSTKEGDTDLRPGTSVVLLVRVGAPRKVLAVPREAVVEINTRPFVFVQVDGEHFEKRAVKLGDVDGGFIEIATGLKDRERVVTLGGFDVHLASLIASVESHRH
jgi:membrane fusion protein, heavy metal efflux system